MGSEEFCRNFSMGKCTRGSKCKYKHGTLQQGHSQGQPAGTAPPRPKQTGPPATRAITCWHCSGDHRRDVCPELSQCTACSKRHAKGACPAKQAELVATLQEELAAIKSRITAASPPYPDQAIYTEEAFDELYMTKELSHHVLASGSLPSGTIILDGAATCTVFTSTTT